MQTMKPKVIITSELSGKGPEIMKHLERIMRTCYKSEHLITEGTESADKLIGHAMKIGHESTVEHYSISVRFFCSRACSHQIVRHRMASYAQESQRYCNYSKDKFDNSITFIEPPFDSSNPYFPCMVDFWRDAMVMAEDSYFKLLEQGAKPQQARTVLPNSCKTELNMTANLREWRAFFKLRCDLAADEEIRYLAKNLLKEFYKELPVVFGDLYEQFFGENAPADPKYDELCIQWSEGYELPRVG